MDGFAVYCGYSDPFNAPLELYKDKSEKIKTCLSWIFQSVTDSTQIIDDARRMEEILKIDPEVLCSRQAKSGACEHHG